MAKVLLADDSTHAQRMGTKILTGEGIEVVAVNNGEAAAKRLAGEAFDLVMADVFMPGRSGYEVCSMVKGSPALSAIPVVLIVGSLEPYDEDEGKRVGADAVLKKPFEASTVVRTITDLIQAAEKRKAAAAPPPPPPEPAGHEVEAQHEEPVMSTVPAAAPMEVPADMQDISIGFDLDEHVTGQAPAPAFELETEPGPGAAEAQFSIPEPFSASSVAGEPQLQSLDFSGEMEPAAPAPQASEPLRWVAEPADVQADDLALFEKPQAAQAVAASRGSAAAPAAAPEEELMLEIPGEPAIEVSIPAPAPVAAQAVAPVEEQAVEAEEVLEAPAESPMAEAQAEPAVEEPALVAEAAPAVSEAAGEVSVAEAPAPAEPAGWDELLERVEEPGAAAAPEPVAPQPTQAELRSAIEAALNRTLPGISAVPGLLDAVTGEIRQHFPGLFTD